MNNGRKQDVLILDSKYTDAKTGLEIVQDNKFNVWADAGLKEIIEAVEGVTGAYATTGKTEYHVYIDPRYDREYLKREVEAAILCGKE